MVPEPKPSLLGMNETELRQVAQQAGLRPFHGTQIAKWIYGRRVTDFEAMTDLPRTARAWLAQNYTIGRSEPLACARSTDGTAKYLFEGAPGRDVEAVYIPDKDRATLCVSSQAGCRMNCAFCMTGRQGFAGNLTAAQILNQVLAIPESEKLTNIVFMGMGEPADNAEAVIAAIEVLTAPWGLAWSPRRITVSTIGKLDGLKAFLDRTDVHIAISVHNPFAEQRGRIMPVQKAFPIDKVMEVLRGYDFAHQRRLSLEYTMFAGMNDSLRHADALAALLKGTSARVNLIRFHKIPGFEGAPGSKETMERFRDRLNQLGVTATIRASRGEDIDAACGMLAGKKNNINSQTQ